MLVQDATVNISPVSPPWSLYHMLSPYRAVFSLQMPWGTASPAAASSLSAIDTTCQHSGLCCCAWSEVPWAFCILALTVCTVHSLLGTFFSASSPRTPLCQHIHTFLQYLKYWLWKVWNDIKTLYVKWKSRIQIACTELWQKYTRT